MLGNQGLAGRWLDRPAGRRGQQPRSSGVEASKPASTPELVANAAVGCRRPLPRVEGVRSDAGPPDLTTAPEAPGNTGAAPGKGRRRLNREGGSLEFGPGTPP